MQPLPTEIVMLGVSVALLLVQLFLQSVSATLEMGGDYKAGPRDQPKLLEGVFAGRAERAFYNLLETFPVFAALALALVVTGRYGWVRRARRGSLGGHARALCAAVLHPDSHMRGAWCGSLRSLRWWRCWRGFSSRVDYGGTDIDRQGCHHHRRKPRHRPRHRHCGGCARLPDRCWLRQQQRGGG